MRAARRFVEHHTDIPEDQRFDAQLLVSELVTNSVRHGRAPIDVQVAIDSGGVRIEVADHGAGVPQDAPGERTCGYGLGLVKAFADRWGVADDPTVVWFELRFTRA